MSAAKVTLSPKELELVNNADWILTKNRIIQKVTDLFGEISNTYRSDAGKYTGFAHSEVFNMEPKISKGEQYQSLPYVMLDYPRFFTQQDVMAIRTFFWWGNHCSIQLVLKGRYLAEYGPSVNNYFQLFGKYAAETRDWYIGIGSDPWQHHFEKDNYLPIADWNGQSVTGLPFLKLAKKIPLQEWDDIDQFMTRHFNRLLAMLTEY
ncbi:MAG: hypothetical protein I8H66_07905 [Sphingobacteriia bacterium]|nr:hypothetical protein [Sphingobacteriia bacterium]